MKRKCFRTIRSKITAVTVSFALVITICFATASYILFQTYIRHNLIQSTEFNLQLVSGVIGQNVTSLDTLSKWCSTNGDIRLYLENRNLSPRESIYAYNRLKDEFQNNRAKDFVQRLIITDSGHTRMLQVGNAIAETYPVNIYNLDRLFLNKHGQTFAWRDIESDPYEWSNSHGPDIIPVMRPIYRNNSKTTIGYVYMAVSAELITDQLSHYTVAPDSRLILTLGSNPYRINRLNFEKLPSDFIQSSEKESDGTMDSKTLVSSVKFKGGSDGTMVSYPVRGTDMMISHSLSREQLLQQRQLFIRLIFLICISIMALGVYITVLINHLINSPIVKMRKRMNAISQGDFTYDPSIEWDNELGEIGRGINHLSRNVVTLMENRLADEKKKQDLEYQMLQSQVNPHFLYNTLNSIKWMATIQGAAGIAEMTTSLSRLLKNITKGTKKVIPLREELALLDDYFLIEQYRYGGSITLQKDIPEELCNNAIPRFTLQPLLENAIFHGIEPKGGAGTIHLEARCADGDVEITVTDDGIGMEEECIRKIFSDEKAAPSGMFQQVGVLNVHKRIQFEFGESYGLTLISKPGVYTKAAVLLPRRPME